jgi:type IV secretory pathway TrbL component
MKKNVLTCACLAVLFLAGVTMAQAPGFQPVGTVRQIMLGIVAPASDVIFAVPSKAPKDDKEWKTVQDSALTLAEAGNLMMMPGRAKDNGDWMKNAKGLLDAGSAAFKASNAKDAKALEDIGDKVEEACENCHTKYLPKPPQ